MKATYPILAVLLSAALTQAYAADNQAMHEAIDDALTMPATPSESSEKSSPGMDELRREAEAGGYQPPSISEIFNSAKRNGITTDWDQQVKVESQSYTEMPVPKRAFEVGKALADIAFLVLAPDDSNQAPSLALVQHANDALMALDPPETVKNEVQKLRQRTQNGELKGAALRNEITRLLNEQAPLLEYEDNPQTRDSGVVMLLSGYLRALYLGAETLAGMKAPTTEQLEMIKALRGTAEHYNDYLATKLSRTFKESIVVQDLAGSLKKILPTLQQAEITQADAKAIAQTLSLLFE